MMVGRRRHSGKPLAESATEFLDAAKSLFERLDSGTVIIHGKRQPIKGDVTLLRWADGLKQCEKDLLGLYLKVNSTLPGSQEIRRQFNPVCVGFRVMFGDVWFFTASPDRRHSKLVWRLMRSRRNDTGLLADDAPTAWRRRYAGPDAPSVYAVDDEDIVEEETFAIVLDEPTRNSLIGVLVVLVLIVGCCFGCGTLTICFYKVNKATKEVSTIQKKHAAEQELKKAG